MGFFEIIGFTACIVGATVLVAWIITFFDKWNDIQYIVREGIPKDIAFLNDKINELSSQENEENDCEEDNLVASLSERLANAENHIVMLEYQNETMMAEIETLKTQKENNVL